jgi:hypothetical protein
MIAAGPFSIQRGRDPAERPRAPMVSWTRIQRFVDDAGWSG